MYNKSRNFNNFYTSVKIMLNPKLKGRPVAFGGSAKSRHGIILAKKAGKAKMTYLIIVPPHYEEYVKYSRLARKICE